MTIHGGVTAMIAGLSLLGSTALAQTKEPRKRIKAPAAVVRQAGDAAAGPATGGGEAASSAGRMTVSFSTTGPNLFLGSLNSQFTLVVPRGRVDLAPELALIYAPGSRNANAGSSWTLAGGMAIERQQKFGVVYDDDSFVLADGGSSSELVAIGNNLFAARYEGRFLRIQKMTDASGVWWNVTQSDGTTLVLGRSPATRMTDPADPSRVFRWNVERREDVNGNWIAYRYIDFQDGNRYLDAIDYTGLASPMTTIAPANQIRFRWEARDDAPPAYTTGFRVAPTRRLRSIDLMSDGKRQRMYTLSYITSAISGANLLARVQQFGSDATITAEGSVSGSALPPRDLRWYADALSFAPGRVVDRDSAAAIDPGQTTGRVWADADGDGRADFCRRIGIQGNRIDSQVRCTLATAAGFGAEFTSGVIEIGADDGRTFVDFNADGKSDFCRGFPTGFTTERASCLLSTGTGFGAEIPSPDFLKTLPEGRSWGDVDGDGRPDYCGITRGARATLQCALSRGTGFGPVITSAPIDPGEETGRAWVDANGDGKSDFCHLVGRTARCLLSTGNGFGPEIASRELDPGYATTRAWADMNGDGLADFCRLVGNTNLQSSFVQCTLSTGSGFAEEFTSGVIDWGAEPGRTFEDVNGDGRADFCRISTPGSARCLLSKGDRFGDEVDTGALDAGDGFGRSWSDRNGDGRADFCRVLTNRFLRCTEITGDHVQPSDALREVTNGVGGATSVEYAWSSTFANRYLPFRMPVVAAVAQSDGRGATIADRFTYRGGFFALAQREMRGFSEVEQRGPVGPDGEQRVEHTWFHQGDQAVPLERDPAGSIGATSGRPYRSETRNGEGTLLHDSVITYRDDLQPPHFTPATVVVQRTIDTSAGAPAGSGIEVEIDAAHDEFGNVTERTLKLGPIGATAVDRVVRSTFAVNRQRWILHKVSTMAAFAPDDLVRPVEEMSFFYDYGNCSTPSTNVTPDRGLLTRYVRRLDGGEWPEVRIGYDAAGNPLCTRDANGHEQHFAYDPSLVFVASVENALGQKQTIAHYGIDASGQGLHGQISGIVDMNGNRETIAYDPFGRTVTTVDFEGAATTVAYIDEGLPASQRVETTLANGLKQRTFYDGLARTYRTEKTATAGRMATVELRFDGRGLLSARTHPFFAGIDTPQVVSFHYDALGRVTRAVQPDGATRFTCYRGRDLAIIDEAGRLRVESYDGLGRLRKAEEYAGAFTACPAFAMAAPVATATYTYDSSGQMTGYVDPNGAIHHYKYDAIGRLVQSQEPDAGTWNFAFDTNGNLIRKTDAAGRNTFYRHDAVNRLVEVDHGPGTSGVTYVYDRGANGNGRLSQTRSDSSSTRFAYDKVGHVIDSTQTIGAQSYQFQYAYDSIGRLSRLTYPNESVALYTYDGPSLTRITDGTSVYAEFTDVNALGQTGTIRYGNGTRNRYAYDPARLWLNSYQLHSASGEVLQSIDYRHFPNGNTQSQTSGNANEAYVYDESDRLTSTSSGGGTQHFTYDLAGNITNGPAGAYAYDDQRQTLSAAGSVRFEYDANGNTVVAGDRRLRYDEFNRPVMIESGGTRRLPRNRLRLVYDERNIVVGRYLYRGFLQTLLSAPGEAVTSIGNSYDCAGSECTQFIGNGSVIFAERHSRDGRLLYYHRDQLGSTRGVTDESGNVVWSAAYEPFGAPRATGSDRPKVLYAGKPFEETFGLFRMGNRLYDPSIGRFYSPDFAGQDRKRPQTLNRYAYVHNNPLNYTDPTGAFERIMMTPDAGGGGGGGGSFSGGSSGGSAGSSGFEGDLFGGSGDSFGGERGGGTPEGPISDRNWPAPEGSVASEPPPTPLPPDSGPRGRIERFVVIGDREVETPMPRDRMPFPVGGVRHGEPGGGVNRESSHYLFDVEFSGGVGVKLGNTTWEYGSEGFNCGVQAGFLSVTTNMHGETAVSVAIPTTVKGLEVNLSTVLNPRDNSLANVTVGLSLNAEVHPKVGGSVGGAVTVKLGEDWWIPISELERHVSNTVLSGGLNGQ